MSVLKGLAAGNAVYGLLLGARLITTVIIARIISPEEMGIWTLGIAVIGLTQVLRDFGTATYIQTAKDLSDDQIRACNGLQLIVGSLFCIAFLLLAKPIAAFYKEPRVAEVIYVLSVGFMILPLSSTIFNWFIRQGRMPLKSAIDFVGQISIYVGSVIFAFAGASYLSAPLAAIVGQLAVVVFCHIKRPKNFPIGYRLKGIKEVSKIGLAAVGVGVLQQASDRAGDIILPKTQGFSVASIYEKGVNCLDLVRQVAVELFGGVLASSLRLRTEKEPGIFPVLSAASVTALALISVMGASLVAFNAESFILTLFGKQWVNARPTLEILALATPMVCVSAFLIKVLYLSQKHYVALKAAIFMRITMIALVFLLSQKSLIALAIGVVTAETVFCAVYIFTTRKMVKWETTVLPILIDSALIVTLVYGASRLTGTFGLSSPFGNLMLSGLIATIAVGACVAIFRRKTVKQIRFALNI